MNWYRIAIWAFVSIFFIYMVLIPTSEWLIESYSPELSKTEQGQEGMSLAEQVRLRSTQAIISLLFFALGATIGSFLNVVVYRMPLGKSVVFQSSSCPACGAKIQSKDNIPIIGWLRLNGRCRNCQVAISSRYPTIEFVTGSIFFLFYVWELISGGGNLPVRNPNAYNGVVWIIFYTKWDLVSIYFFHCFAITVLLTWAMIDVDRQRDHFSQTMDRNPTPGKVPLSMQLLVMTVLLALPNDYVASLMASIVRVPLFGSELMLVPLVPSKVLDLNAPQWLLVSGTGVAGGLVGALLGWLTRLAAPRSTLSTVALSTDSSPTDSSPSAVLPCTTLPGTTLPSTTLPSKANSEGFGQIHPFYSHCISCGIIVGLSVGWQATIGIWILTLLLRIIFHFGSRLANFNEPPTTMLMLIAYLIHLLAWRQLTVPLWPSYKTTALGWVLTATVLSALYWIHHSMRVRWRQEDIQLDSNESIDLDSQTEMELADGPHHQNQNDDLVDVGENEDGKVPDAMDSDSPAGPI